MMINFTRQTKISNFKFSIMNKNILRLDIPMDKMAIVKYMIALGKLLKESPNYFFRAVMIIFDIVLKRTTIAIFHNKIKIILSNYL